MKRILIFVLIASTFAFGQWQVGSRSFGFSGGSTAATPSFSPASPYFYIGSSVSVSLSCSTPSSSIYYTTDGSTPTTGSTLYTGTISASSVETLKAICTASGYSNSATASASVQQSTLIAGWKMTENAGTTSADVLGAGNTLTLGATDTWTTTSLPTSGGCNGLTAALVLPGTSSSSNATITSSTPLNIEYTQAFSVNTCMKITSNVLAGGTVIGHFNTGTGFAGWELGEYYDGVANRFWLVLNHTWSTNALQCLSTNASDLGSGWHMIGATYSGSGACSGVTMYVDGISIAFTSAAAATITATMLNATVVNLGGRVDGSSLAKIQLGPTYVHSRVLSGSEESALSANPYSPPN